MFWDTIIMSEGVNLATRHLGPQGRFRSVTKSFTDSNVALYTKAGGRFWYGDVDIFQDKDALKKIARGMKETLYVISGAAFNISNPKNVLLEVTV